MPVTVTLVPYFCNDKLLHKLSGMKLDCEPQSNNARAFFMLMTTVERRTCCLSDENVAIIFDGSGLCARKSLALDEVSGCSVVLWLALHLRHDYFDLHAWSLWQERKQLLQSLSSFTLTMRCDIGKFKNRSHL